MKPKSKLVKVGVAKEKVCVMKKVVWSWPEWPDQWICLCIAI